MLKGPFPLKNPMIFRVEHKQKTIASTECSNLKKNMNVRFSPLPAHMLFIG
jgi:hypothetical protein